MEGEIFLSSKEQQAGGNQHVNDISQIISDDVMLYLDIYLSTVGRTILSVAGIVTNLINMIIFSKLGLKDSSSVGLFSLSLADFLVTSIQMASCICYIIGFLCPDMSAQTRYIDLYFIGWAYSTFYEISCWITAMVSSERCYCVVYPFKVKQVFTRYRCISFIMIIYVLHIAIHVPVYTINRQEFVEIVTAPGNTTFIVTPERTSKVTFNEEITTVELILDLTAGVSMWLVSQAVIIVCALRMGYSLEASSKVRQNVSNESQCTSRSYLPGHYNHSKLSNRERRLVKVVLCLAITLTLCNIPKLIGITLYYTLHDDDSNKHHNILRFVWASVSAFGSLGSSITFVVYLTLNSSYRRGLLPSALSSQIPR